MDKVDKFNKLINKMALCNKCINMKNKNGIDCSLINIYENKEFAKNIPSVWTDWYNRLNSKIMIIGQDWGPYNDMEKIYNKYKENKTKENWNKIINEEKSMTKKMLENYLIQSSKDENILDKIYITNAIMCARKGNNYRGNNIKLKDSTKNCLEYIKMQIDIVNPKVILTLGYYPLYSLSQIFKFNIEKQLTDTIKKQSYFKVDNIVIIPLYHPTAQVKREIQLQQYKKIWNFI